MLSSPIIERLDHRTLILTRLAQRSLTLQPGNSLISPKLTLSVGFSISIALHAATQARRLLAFTAAGLLSPLTSMRVTLWITTAFHLDTPTKDLTPRPLLIWGGTLHLKLTDAVGIRTLTGKSRAILPCAVMWEEKIRKGIRLMRYTLDAEEPKTSFQLSLCNQPVKTYCLVCAAHIRRLIPWIG